jgi:hypothetical protein
MTQHIVAGLIVGYALLYSAWALLPAALRLRMAAAMGQMALRTGMRTAAVERLQEAVTAQGGCSECSSCERGCQQPPTTFSVVALPARRRRDEARGAQRLD